MFTLVVFMHHKVLFTSDIHGNEVQYRKLVDYAIEISADSVIIGGDIAPKKFRDDSSIVGQRVFLEERLPELLRPLKVKGQSTVFLMMGNDDCAANLDVLEEKDSSLFKLIHGKRIELTREIDVVGYSYVPITPFGIKDWEKYDLSEVPENLFEVYRLRKILNYKLFGFKTEETEWKKFKFTPEMEEKDSIQKDLSSDLFCKSPEKTVYVFHAPPDNTDLDQLYNGSHAGSMAVRLFIEKHQPYLTLHGHIHETVKRSGSYKQKIGKTLCLTAGNNNFGIELAVLVFDLYKPEQVTRKII